MNPETTGLGDVMKALASIQDELARLASRVAALESASAPIAPPLPTPARAVESTGAAETLGDEVVLILGAAVAAFLGKKAHIRGIQLLDSTAWAQQGRVAIQASHALSTGRSQP